jgi:hypothetical protein
MAVVTIAHKPDLDVNDAFRIFQQHFSHYEVFDKDGGPVPSLRDFVVKKNGLTAVSVVLMQEPNRTSFVFTGYAPSGTYRLLMVLTLGVLIIPIILIAWTPLTNEIKSFINEAEEFK